MPTFLRTLCASYDRGHEIGDHAHGWGQLVYAASGAIHVVASHQVWLIPSARAVWLSPGSSHNLRMRSETRLRTIYIPAERCGDLSPEPIGLGVSPLLRELILELARNGPVEDSDSFHHILGEAFLVALARAERSPLTLAMPIDRRALRVAEAIFADTANSSSLETIVSHSGGSLRTVQRRFLGETGMALSEWRQQARLIAAAGLLLDGQSVTAAALEVGYSSVSAFIHAFRQKLGQTPSRFRATATAGGA